MRCRITGIGVVLLACLVLAAPAARGQAQLAVFEDMLRAKGVKADAAGISAYLKALQPTDESNRKAAELIKQLGNDDYHVREAATRQLMAFPYVPDALLRQASASDDPEVRMRADQVLEDARQGDRYRVMAAAYRVLGGRKLTAALPAVLEALPLCNEEPVVHAASEALQQLATAPDAELLRRWRGHAEPHVRAAVAAALGAALGAEAVADLRQALEDKHDRVRLSAARALASLGERDSLPALLQLLASPEVRVRAQAAGILRALSGQRIAFNAWGDEPSRSAGAAAWRKWVEGEGKAAKFLLPLREKPLELGRTLIACYATNTVVELDASGKEVWTVKGVAYPWGVYGLPSGHRFVAAYSTQKVIEYDAAGKEVWSMTTPGNPWSLQVLEDGNLLMCITGGAGGKVIEMDRAGKVVWEASVGRQPTDARRLENGNTLVTSVSPGQVVELDPRGKEVARLAPAGLSTPRAVVRLENGNTLVADAGRSTVTEYSPDGKEVSKITGLRGPMDVQRLPNGNTLVAEQSGVREFDPTGKQVSEARYPNAARVHRY